MVGDGHFDIKSLNSHEDNFSLQYQYYIKQTLVMRINIS